MLVFALLTVALLAEEPDAPARVASEITVTATRTETRIADTPASVVVLSRATIESTPAPTADDMLRQVPGFTLFRRAGSRVANPTTQGVTLRGIGASGASRALVLDDGVPLNDPFGGWVYWGRIARTSLQRVEVLRGGGSDLYGSGAMGGVIHFIRRRDPSVSAEISGGSHETLAGSLFAAFGRDQWRGSVAIDAFDTAGHVLVEPESRGAVDVAADSEHLAADVSIRRNAAFLRFSHYDEARNNGTRLQVNDTTIRQLAGGFDSPLAGGRLDARGWIGEQDYHQTFSAIFAGRSGERLTNVQDIPSSNGGASAQWTRGFANTHALVAGAEMRRVEALDREQATTAAFIEDVMVLAPSLSLTAGLRFDAWEGRDAWSPRVAVLYRPRRGPSWSASAYRAFRAPTLNELYRDFRVGNVVTLANDALGGETVTGFEIGARGDHLRATLFWMELDELISNVTLTVTPSLITRQRQNVASGRSRGAEIEGEWRFSPSLRASAGYLFAEARFADGNRFPQVPRHQATAQLTWSSRFTTSLQTRWSAMQYDDDLNRLALASYFVADAFVAVPIARGLQAIVAAENLTDARVEVAATPVTTLGQPRSIRIGLRYGR